MMKFISIPGLLAGLCLALAGCATDAHRHGMTAADAAAPSRDRDKMWRETLARPSLAVTGTFDEKGWLWTVAIQGQHLRVNHSDDLGVSWSTPVRVNMDAENILGDGENRPKIIARNGIVYVSYTQGLAKPMSGNIRFARSVDGGKTFSAPVTVNDNRDIISHRFEALAVSDKGEIHLAWLDKRAQHDAQSSNIPYRGAALYHAVSRDGGASFGANTKLADHSCECCRVAMAMDPSGTPVIVWRHVYGKNVRDHAVLRLDGASQPQRVAHDNWRIDACPHHGPTLGIAPDGTYHVAWFTGATANPGLFYARSSDAGKHFSAPLAFGNPAAQAGRPQVLALGARVWLAWKEFDGKRAVIRGQHSRDGGRTFAKPVTLAASEGASDHPLLISNGARALLSWNSAAEGLRVLPLSGVQP